MNRKNFIKLRFLTTAGIPFKDMDYYGYILFVLIFILLSLSNRIIAQPNIYIEWDNIIRLSKTTPTLQVVALPPLERTSAIHDKSFEALRNLNAEYVRFVPWYPYPYLAVPELRPPTEDSTFWNFGKIDPIVEDFMENVHKNSVVMNFSTIPLWMFKEGDSIKIPTDPKQELRSYSKGSLFKDTTLKQLTEYYIRLFKWYTKGGFTDELGKLHKSSHHYYFNYWEILNEMEHHLSPVLYTRIYDSIVLNLKRISPKTKFIGLALGTSFNPNYKRSTGNPRFFTYFLNPENHAPDVPIDGISYHFYAYPGFRKQSLEDYQYSFFNQADYFLNLVNYIESIKNRLSQHTFTHVNEIGSILRSQKDIPHAYWNLSGALFAYLYIELSKIGIEVVGESQLIGYPKYRYLSTGMLNLEDGKPNARYWILKLLIDNFGPGDRLVNTISSSSQVAAQGFITNEGKKILLINKRNKSIMLNLPEGVKGSVVHSVNISTGENSLTDQRLVDNRITLKPFSVAVIEFQ